MIVVVIMETVGRRGGANLPWSFAGLLERRGTGPAKSPGFGHGKSVADPACGVGLRAAGDPSFKHKLRGKCAKRNTEELIRSKGRDKMAHYARGARDEKEVDA